MNLNVRRPDADCSFPLSARCTAAARFLYARNQFGGARAVYCATLNCGQIITHRVSTRRQPTRTVCTAADKSQIKMMIEPQKRLWKFNFNQIFEIFEMNLFYSTPFTELSDSECLVGIKLKSKSWQSSSASALSPLRSLLRRPAARRALHQISLARAGWNLETEGDLEMMRFGLPKFKERLIHLIMSRTHF